MTMDAKEDAYHDALAKVDHNSMDDRRAEAALAVLPKCVEAMEGLLGLCGSQGINDSAMNVARAALKEAREAMLIAAAEETMGEWKDIDSAPKDGTRVLLFRRGSQFVGYYGGGQSGWRHNTDDMRAMWPLPTKWMPLPPDPAYLANPK